MAYAASARTQLASAWNQVVHDGPGKECVVLDGKIKASYTVKHIDACAQAIAQALGECTLLRHSSSVGIALGPGASEAASILACAVYRRIPWVPLPYGMLASSTASQTLKRLGRSVAVVVVAARDIEDISAASNEPRSYIVLHEDGSIAQKIICDEQSSPLRTKKARGDTLGDGAETECAFPEDILYIMRTSGTTSGTPKFVFGQCSSTLNRLKWQWRTLPFGSKEVVCRRSPLVFVDSVAEILGTLLGGASLFVPHQTLEQDPEIFISACSSASVTRITLVPSLLAVLLRCALNASTGACGSGRGGPPCADASGEDSARFLRKALPSLSCWTVSGEPMTSILLDMFARGVFGESRVFSRGASNTGCFSARQSMRSGDPPIRLLNIYGSTEVSADVTCCVLLGPPLHALQESRGGDCLSTATLTCSSASANLAVPVGFPIDGVCIDIVQEERNGEGGDISSCSSPSSSPSLIRGVEGMLVVRGVAVSAGYYDMESGENAVETSPFKSEAKFGEDAERSFRMGDVGFRCAVCSTMFVVGRKDNQVKIRGIRISLEEAEEELGRVAALEGLECSIAVVAHGPPTEQRLVAFAAAGFQEAAGGAAPISTAKYLAAAAAKHLPPHFVPSLVLEEKCLPRTATAKIDRLALKLKLKATQTRAAHSHAVVSSLPPFGFGSPFEKRDWLLQWWKAWLKSTLSDLNVSHGLSFDHDGKSSFDDCSGTHLTAAQSPITLRSIGFDSLNAIELTWKCGQEVQRLRALFGDDNSQQERLPLPTASDYLVNPISEIIEALARAVSDQTAQAPLSSPSNSSLSAAEAPSLAGGSVRSGTVSSHSLSSSRFCDAASLHTHWVTKAGLTNQRVPFPYLSVPQAFPEEGSHLNKGMSIRWRLNMNRCIDASALVVSNQSSTDLVAFIGSHSKEVVSFNVVTGKEVWRRIVVDSAAPQVGDDAAIEATAAISNDGRVLLVSSYDGCLYGLDVVDGSELWRVPSGAEVKGSPLVLPPNVFSGCSQMAVFGSHDCVLRCVCIGSSNDGGCDNCTNGSVLWSVTLDGAIYASPVFAWLRLAAKENHCADSASGTGSQRASELSSSDDKGVLLAATTAGSLYAFTSTDEYSLLWRYRGGSPIFSTPVVDSNNDLVLFGDVSGKVIALSLSDGAQRWATLGSRSVFCSPALWPPPQDYRGPPYAPPLPMDLGEDASEKEEERVVVVGAHDGVLSCRSVATGRKKWATCLATPVPSPKSTTDGNVETSSPIFAAPFVFRLQGTKVGVAAAAQSGLLAICDLSDGSVLASIRLPGQLFSSPVVLAMGTRHVMSKLKSNNECSAGATSANSTLASRPLSFRVLIGCRDDHMYGLDYVLSDEE